MAKKTQPLFSTATFSVGGWAVDLRKGIIARQRFSSDVDAEIPHLASLRSPVGAVRT